MNPSALTQVPPSVPVEYAEKAMGSLMKLHGELMEEKERRVDLYRRLMEKEQTLAELKMYVKLLEEKLTPGVVKPATVTAPPVEAKASRVEPLRVVSSPSSGTRAEPPAAVRAVPRPPPRPTIRSEKPASASAPRAVPNAVQAKLADAPPLPPAAPSRRTADGWKSW